MATLSCERCVDRFGEYVDGVLPSEERDGLEAHLRACATCRSSLDDYRGLPGILRRATDVRMPPDVRARLRRLLSRAWRHR